jgi:hypothetical protein
MTISDQSTRKILDAAMALAIRGAVQSLAAGRPDGVGVVEGLAKPRWLCPLLREGWTLSHVDLDDKSTNRITLISLCYSSKE